MDGLDPSTIILHAFTIVIPAYILNWIKNGTLFFLSYELLDLSINQPTNLRK